MCREPTMKLATTICILALAAFVPTVAMPSDLDKNATELAEKIKPQLPAGWSVVALKNIVTVSRQKPVEWYCMISLPTHDVAELKAMGFVQSGTCTITVELSPPLTPDEVARLEKENALATKEYYEKHPVDPLRKPTTPTRELTDRLHRIPNVLTPGYSALFTPFYKQGWMAFCDEGEKAECLRVEQTVSKSVEPVK
jgi:hypothetical protein